MKNLTEALKTFAASASKQQACTEACIGIKIIGCQTLGNHKLFDQTVTSSSVSSGLSSRKLRDIQYFTADEQAFNLIKHDWLPLQAHTAKYHELFEIKSVTVYNLAKR